MDAETYYVQVNIEVFIVNSISQSSYRSIITKKKIRILFKTCNKMPYNQIKHVSTQNVDTVRYNIGSGK